MKYVNCNFPIIIVQYSLYYSFLCTNSFTEMELLSTIFRHFHQEHSYSILLEYSFSVCLSQPHTKPGNVTVSFLFDTDLLLLIFFYKTLKS